MDFAKRNMEMFNDIAEGYDKSNDIMTIGRHKSWYRSIAKTADMHPGQSLLDCATGTGSVAIAFQKYYNSTINVTGVDVADNMLGIAERKAKAEGLKINFEHRDILNLQYEDNVFDVATISFGIRNTVSPELCLKEMARAVKPGGLVMILETGKSSGIKFLFYKLYQKLFVETIGTKITGNKSAYRYFAESTNNFPSGREFTEIMQNTNCFDEIKLRTFMLGMIFLYIGKVK